jgi:hypothetical protein
MRQLQAEAGAFLRQESGPEILDRRVNIPTTSMSNGRFEIDGHPMRPPTTSIAIHSVYGEDPVILQHLRVGSGISGNRTAST